MNPPTPAPRRVRRTLLVGLATRPAPIAAPARPATPFEQATRALQDQAAALLRGDLDGWPAAVDPARKDLVTRYRAMFTNLGGCASRTPST